MINYSKNLLKNFKLLRDNNIIRNKEIVVLDIDGTTYKQLYSMYSAKYTTENRYPSGANWITLFNNGDDIYKIVSKYPEITTVSILDRYFRNQFVALELNGTLDKSNSKFEEWLTHEYIDLGHSLRFISEKYGYAFKVLHSACKKFKIRRSTVINRKSSALETPYKKIKLAPRDFLNNKEDIDILNKALSILTKYNDPKEVYKQLNLSPRCARRLFSDYNIIKANKIPYNTIIKLINRRHLTLREINTRLNLPKRIQFYINTNVFAALLVGRSIDDIFTEECRKCVFPSICGDNTYLVRVKGKAGLKPIINILSRRDSNFLHDLKKIEVIAKYKDIDKAIEHLECTKDELNSLMTKYYIYDYVKGGKINGICK